MARSVESALQQAFQGVDCFFVMQSTSLFARIYFKYTHSSGTLTHWLHIQSHPVIMTKTLGNHTKAEALREATRTLNSLVNRNRVDQNYTNFVNALLLEHDRKGWLQDLKEAGFQVLSLI